MIIDAFASFLCFIFAMSCFIMHVLSSPKREHWINLPEYVRFGLFAAGASVMYRGINLAVLSGEVAPVSPGHINSEALIALAILTYTFTAFSVHVLRRTFPTRVWARLNYIESLACCSNNGALAVLASLGFKVVPPGGATEDLKKATRMTDSV